MGKNCCEKLTSEAASLSLRSSTVPRADSKEDSSDSHFSVNSILSERRVLSSSFLDFSAPSHSII